MTKFARGIVGATLAGGLALLVGSREADAAFTYNSTPAPAVFTFGGTTVTLGPVSSVTPQSGTTIIAGVDVTFVTGTAPPATDTGNAVFTDTILINPSSGGSVTLTPVNTLSIFRSDTGGEVSTDTLTDGKLTGTNGTFTYTISAIQYAGPTINNAGTGTGKISYIITETGAPLATPEPATFGMAAVAGLFGLGYTLRRRAAK